MVFLVDKHGYSDRKKATSRPARGAIDRLAHSQTLRHSRFMTYVRSADPCDADLLAPRLRLADRSEIEAVVGSISPTVVLRRGVESSTPCFAVVANGSVLALFGVVPIARLPETGSVWLLASEDFAARPAFIVRSSKAWLAQLHERYRVLTNFVDARNEVHIRWLRWCGFVFVRKIERFGAMGLPFYEVRRERDASTAEARGPEGSLPDHRTIYASAQSPSATK